MPSSSSVVPRAFLPCGRGVRYAPGLLVRCCGLLVVGLGLALAVARAQDAAATAAPRERVLIDSDWRFAFGHPSDPAKDFDYATRELSIFAKAGRGDGPASPTFDDAAWRQLDLPHDWAVELPFVTNGSESHGYKPVGRGFPDTSVAWYRKTFVVPVTDVGRRISVEFDGVYRDAVVWINGYYLGRHASGYTSFRYDLTDFLNYGGPNTVVVRVDATMEEGWFYEGAGIYRHVWLTKTAPLHVAAWGTFVTSEMRDTTAEVTARTTVANDAPATATFTLEQQILDARGQPTATKQIENLVLPAGNTGEFSSMLTVAQPQLWSVETPTLHTLVTTLRTNDVGVDRAETTFGIRTIRFDPDHGFFVNGQRLELKGMNNHQDHAGVGVAVPDALQVFRVARLKEMGCNAWRCSPHPPTPELLDACDRLGMLVIDENRLMASSAESLGELETLIVRDRNHPSVILWSLGNEEWALERTIAGARIVTSMQTAVHRLDPTRPVTAAVAGNWGEGVSSVLEVMGYNYITHGSTDAHHAAFPRQPAVGTEECTTQSTRGIYFDDRTRGHLSPQEHGDTGGNCEMGWSHYATRPYLAGLFFWTGFDYRGEPKPFGWPQVATHFGLLDSCGFPKDSFYYLQSWWTAEPVLHLMPHWNWPGREGEAITVTCFSNHDAVELLLNGQSLGQQKMPRNGHLEWKVAYRPGVLEARGYRGGALVQTTRVETTGPAARLVLALDHDQPAADGSRVAVVAVSAVDAHGRTVPTADNNVRFAITGGTIIGVGNGDPGSHEPDRFIDDVRLLVIEDWRGRIAPTGAMMPSAPDTPKPLPLLGHWSARLPQPDERYDLAATFFLGAVPADAELRLFVPSLGTKTTLWVNGHEQIHELDTSDQGPSILLDRRQLVDGVNRVQLLVAPFADGLNRIPEVTRLGAVQFRTPARAWQRHLFNGYAQVILRREPNQIAALVLRAESGDLAPAEIRVPEMR